MQYLSDRRPREGERGEEGKNSDFVAVKKKIALGGVKKPSKKWEGKIVKKLAQQALRSLVRSLLQEKKVRTEASRPDAAKQSKKLFEWWGARTTISPLPP